MKKIVVLGVLTVLMSLNTGCVSYLNHSRVKENMIRSRIVASGDQNKLQLLARGVKPSQAVRVVPIEGGPQGAQGAMLLFDISDLEGLGSWFTTYAEAPISSTVSLGVDGAIVYFGGKALIDAVDGDDDDKDKGDTTINVTGDNNNTAVNNGDGGNTTTASTSTSTSNGEGSSEVENEQTTSANQQ